LAAAQSAQVDTATTPGAEEAVIVRSVGAAATISFSARRRATSWVDLLDNLCGAAALPVEGTLVCVSGSGTRSMPSAVLTRAETNIHGMGSTTSYSFVGASILRS
jgi:hypothetical protein